MYEDPIGDMCQRMLFISYCMILLVGVHLLLLLTRFEHAFIVLKYKTATACSKVWVWLP
jgi:hypothetical protein